MSLILCIDTSGPFCAVAALDNAKIRAALSENMSKGQAERLFPMIEEAMTNAGVALGELDAIAVAIGPGNFTGVRIAVSAARGLALSLGIPAIGVNVLEALAFAHNGQVLATIDARGDRLYAQSFKAGQPLGEPSLLALDDLSKHFANIDACVGFRADECAEKLGAKTSDEAHPAPHTYGLIAAQRDWDTAPRPAPLYLRPPDAALPSEPPPRIIQ